MTTTHRNSLLATLSPEQLPVAEQLLRGGMPSVRAAVAEQNKNATAQGRPTIDATTIDRIAEELLGKTNLALWKDRRGGRHWSRSRTATARSSRGRHFGQGPFLWTKKLALS